MNAKQKSSSWQRDEKKKRDNVSMTDIVNICG